MKQINKSQDETEQNSCHDILFDKNVFQYQLHNIKSWHTNYQKFQVEIFLESYYLPKVCGFSNKKIWTIENVLTQYDIIYIVRWML